MRDLPAELRTLSERKNLSAVPIVIINSYSARGAPYGQDVQEDRRFSAWVDQKQWAFSDTAFQIGNLDVQPYLVSMTPYEQSITHNPASTSVASGLVRNFLFTLRNGVTDVGVRLIEELRDNNITMADVCVGQLLLNRPVGRTETDLLRSETLDSYVAFYRGFVQQPTGITNDVIQMFCNSHTPFGALGRYVITPDTADSELSFTGAVGATLPTMYGHPRRIPGIPFRYGFRTTLSSVMASGQNFADLSDLPDSNTPISGTVYIGGEEATYASFRDVGNQRTLIEGMVREDDSITHQPGEIVSFQPTEVMFYTAVYGKPGTVSDPTPNDIRHYLRNPSNGELLQDTFSSGIGAVSGGTDRGSVRYTTANWSAAMAAMTQSAVVFKNAKYDVDVGTDDTSEIIDTNAATTNLTGVTGCVFSNLGTDNIRWERDSTDTSKRATRVVAAGDFGATSSLVVSRLRARFDIDVITVVGDLTVLGGSFEGTVETLFGDLVATAGTSQMASVGAFTVFSPWQDGDGVGDIDDSVVGQDIHIEFPIFGTGTSNQDGYQINIRVHIEYFWQDADVGVLTEPALASGAAVGVGVEGFYDGSPNTSINHVGGDDGTETTLRYREPGLSLHRASDWEASSNVSLIEARVEAWHRYARAFSSVSSGSSVIELHPPAGSLDLVGSSPDVATALGWMGYRVTNIGTATLSVLVSNENVTFPTLPTNFRTFTGQTLVDGNYHSAFASTADTGTPVLTDIRTIRITIANQSVSDLTLDVWHIGALSVEADVWIGALQDEDIVHPADHLRSFLAKTCNLPTTHLDETTLAELEANLGSTHEAHILSSDWDIIDDHVEFLLRFGLEHRFQVISIDRDDSTKYKFLSAESDFGWPAATRTITEHGEIREEGVDTSQIYTRRLFAYDIDRSVGRDISAARRAISVSSTQNDIPGTVATSLITDAEDIYGALQGPDMLLASVTDDVTAEALAGYFFLEHLNARRVFAIPGVPWIEAYDLEVGDIIDFTPPWYTVAIKARVLLTSKDWATELVDLRVVEVS